MNSLPQNFLNYLNEHNSFTLDKWNFNKEHIEFHCKYNDIRDKIHIGGCYVNDDNNRHFSMWKYNIKDKKFEQIDMNDTGFETIIESYGNWDDIIKKYIK